MYTEEEKLVTAYTGMDGHKDTAFAKINYTVKAGATGTATITLKNIVITNTLGEKTSISGTVTKPVTISEEEILPTSKTLSNISVTTKPSKVTYTEGQSFDKTGMVVTASYSDGTSSEVTNYTYAPNENLATTDTKITISYTEGNITKTVEQEITVTKVNTGNNGNTTQKDPTVANKVISQTGITNYVIIAILIIAILGTVSYVKYKKYKGI